MNNTSLLALVVVVGSRTRYTSGRPPADLWQTSSSQPLRWRALLQSNSQCLWQTSSRPPADTSTSNAPPPPADLRQTRSPRTYHHLRRPRGPFFASTGFSAHTGLLLRPWFEKFFGPKHNRVYCCGLNSKNSLGLNTLECVDAALIRKKFFGFKSNFNSFVSLISASFKYIFDS